jgi:hypothetical protein
VFRPRTMASFFLPLLKPKWVNTEGKWRIQMGPGMRFSVFRGVFLVLRRFPWVAHLELIERRSQVQFLTLLPRSPRPCLGVSPRFVPGR